MESKRDAVIRLIEGKKHVSINLIIDRLSEVKTVPVENVELQIKGNLLVINSQLQVPIEDKYIVDIGTETANIQFVDSDQQRVTVKILAR